MKKIMVLRVGKTIATGCFLAVLLMPNGVIAAEKKSWKVSADLSLVSCNGNTKSLTVTSKSKFTYDWTKTGLELEAGGLGSQNNTGVIAEQYFSSEKVLWKWSERNYLFEKVRWDKNRFAGIKNRYDSSAGLGRQLIKSEKDNLIAELGGGYVIEEQEPSGDKEYAAGRAYTGYKHKLSETANFEQSAEYLTNLKDANDYRINTVSSLTAAISTYFSLKLSYQWSKVNMPPVGFAENDTITSASVIFNY